MQLYFQRTFSFEVHKKIKKYVRKYNSVRVVVLNIIKYECVIWIHFPKFGHINKVAEWLIKYHIAS